MSNYDFSGWATKNNVRCADGVTIKKDAFIGNNGKSVPLVWNHQHNTADNVLGHALLENREDGVYAYCTLNDTESGKNAKLLVQHGDVTALSIYANRLKKDGSNVIHGAIREVSLVLAGANPAAYIDNVISHADGEEPDEAIFYSGEQFELAHSDEEEEVTNTEEPDSEEVKHADEETVGDVFNSFTEKQKTVVYALIGEALKNEDDNEEDSNMKHNAFDNQENEVEENTISHADMKAVIDDAKRYGSMKDSALQHGITDIEFLFPDAQNLNKTPGWIKRDTGWVSGFLSGVHHTPFSRIKSQFANITEEDARAKGYIKGNKKKDEVFSLLKRSTTPTTIYKKQKLERDDVIDITDFDVIGWIKAEMRMMLDEEIARAALVGDGRMSSSDDKINETNIRPIVSDDDFYTIKAKVASPATDTEDARGKKLIRAAVKARKEYKGSGSPTFYTTEDVLTDMLLMEDSIGRLLYDSVEKLAKVLRVKEIVTVPVMEGVQVTIKESKYDVLGVIVNIADYTIGADKGGAVNMFDDFDIDYNAQKYLIETRCSGALTVPASAITLYLDKTEA